MNMKEPKKTMNLMLKIFLSTLGTQAQTHPLISFIMEICAWVIQGNLVSLSSPATLLVLGIRWVRGRYLRMGLIGKKC